MLSDNQKRWGVDQWAAYLSTRELPCVPRSKAMLLALEADRGEKLSPLELAEIAGSDPLLCLHLLRAAEERRVRRLGHETTTPLAAVMQLGTEAFRTLLANSPETDENNRGLAHCERNCYLAQQLAMRWGTARADVSPDEVAMAALLSETGELLLWLVAPDIPQKAQTTLRSGRVARSAQAQIDTCGFRFKDLTLKLAAAWNLPTLLTQLIRGVDNTRANLSRLCVDTARHLNSGGPGDPALPSNLAEARHRIPGASLEWLAQQLPDVDETQCAGIVEQATALLDSIPD